MLLRTPQSGVRVSGEGFHVRSIRRIGRGADAHRDEELLLVDGERKSGRLENFLSDFRGVLFRAYSLDEDCKLVSTEAGHCVPCPDAVSYAFRNLPEKPISERIAKGFVDRGEAVEV